MNLFVTDEFWPEWFIKEENSIPTYIYGTGVGGRHVFEILSRSNIDTITGFLDSFEEGTLCNKPILMPSKIPHDADVKIIIASQYVNEILPHLERLQKAEILDLSGWISKNLTVLQRALPNSLRICISSFLTADIYETLDQRQFDCAREKWGEFQYGKKPNTVDSALLHALWFLKAHRILHAADALYSWVNFGNITSCGLNIIDDGKNKNLVLNSGLHFSAADRANAIKELYHEFKDNLIIGEICALTLSRCLGKAGQFENGLHLLEKQRKKGIAIPDYQHLIENAINAFSFALSRTKVPDPLARFIGNDNGYLASRTCDRPFQRFDIQTDGSVMVCCGHFMRKTIGNVIDMSEVAVLNSKSAQDIRKSVLDGSFEYCDLSKCSVSAKGELCDKKTETNSVLREAIDTKKTTVNFPYHVVFGYDQSCNLSCPSCRTELILEKFPAKNAKVKVVEDIILPLLEETRKVTINVAGEVFASKPSRVLLSKLNSVDFPAMELDLISNGILFTKKQWDSFPNIHDMIGEIRISSDALTKDTFEKLRRGGVHEVFVENMFFLGNLRSSNKIKRLITSFTYQVDNFREMVDFIKWCKSLNCDHVRFEKLENIVFSEADYLQKAVHKPTHPNHLEFLKTLSDPIFRDPIVCLDFAPFS